VVFSVMESTHGRPGWVRSGSQMCYFRNGYKYMSKKMKQRSHYTLTFTLSFIHRGI